MKQKHTKHTTIYAMIKNETKRTLKNVINEKAIDKRKSHINSFKKKKLNNLSIDRRSGILALVDVIRPYWYHLITIIRRNPI